MLAALLVAGLLTCPIGQVKPSLATLEVELKKLERATGICKASPQASAAIDRGYASAGEALRNHTGAASAEGRVHASVLLLRLVTSSRKRLEAGELCDHDRYYEAALGLAGVETALEEIIIHGFAELRKTTSSTRTRERCNILPGPLHWKVPGCLPGCPK